MHRRFGGLFLGVRLLVGEAAVEFLLVVSLFGVLGLSFLDEFVARLFLERRLLLVRHLGRSGGLRLWHGRRRGQHRSARRRPCGLLLRRHRLLGRLRWWTGRRARWALLRRLRRPVQVRRGALQRGFVDRRRREPDGPDVLDQVGLRRDAVGAQVEVDRGGPDPLAVAVERDRDGGLRRLRQPVDVVAALGHHQRRPVQVLEQPVLLLDLELLPVEHRAARRADGVEDPRDPEVRPRLFRAEPGHAPDEPLGDVVLASREHPQLVGVRLGRRREVPLRLVAVVLEVVAGGVIELVARVEPGAAAVAVHPAAQAPEQRRDVVRGQPLVWGAVLGDYLAGQLVVPADGPVLRGDLAPVSRSGAQQGQSDLLDQGVLLRRVQLRRRLCHGDILTARARECTPPTGLIPGCPADTRPDLG